MCARRFLTVMFVMTLLAVAAAFAVYQFGGRALTRYATPKGHFTAPAASDGPDYANPASWIDHPGLRSSPSLWRPSNDPVSTAPRGRAEIFYLHPTTYLATDRWNAPMCDGEECGESGKRAELFVRTQASAFSDAGTVWAPRYRQAAFGAFLLDNRDARRALDLAYGDVAKAFDAFVAAIPPDAPIILAGHSQGALHLSRLLSDKVAGKPLARRVVAAYVVGWPLSLTADLPATGLPACRAADQAGCILSWQSFAEPANPSLILDAWSGTKGPTGLERKRADMLCTNPISGTLGGTAPPSANAGTLVPTADFADAALVAGQVGARCEDGFLILTGALPPLGPYVLPGNNYHVYDYALFWGSIRADAARRMAAWRH